MIFASRDIVNGKTSGGTSKSFEFDKISQVKYGSKTLTWQIVNPWWYFEAYILVQKYENFHVKFSKTNIEGAIIIASNFCSVLGKCIIKQ